MLKIQAITPAYTFRYQWPLSALPGVAQEDLSPFPLVEQPREGVPDGLLLALPPVGYNNPFDLPVDNEDGCQGLRLREGPVAVKEPYHRLIRQLTDEMIGTSGSEQQLFRRAAAYHAVGDRVAALEDLRRVVEFNPANTKALSNLGVLLFETGARDDGLKRLTELTTTYPDYVDGFYNRGVCHYLSKDLDSAQGAFEAVLKLDPKDFEAIYNLGIVCINTDDFPRAYQLFSHAVALRPTDSGSLMNEGIALFHLNQPDEAEGKLKEALELQPGQPLILYNLGLVCKNHNPVLATSSFEQILFNPDPFLAEHGPANYGFLCLRQNQYAKALAVFTPLTERHPTQPVYWHNRGWANFKLGHHQAALGDFSRALAVNPQFTESYLDRAAVYQALKLPSKAFQDLDQVLSIALAQGGQQLQARIDALRRQPIA